MIFQPLIRLSDIVLISRTNMCQWASMDFALNSENFSANFTIKQPSRARLVLVFANRREITKFIASKDEAAAHLRPYVKLMRTLPSQRFVLTFDELATEVGSRVPQFSQVRTERQIVESIIRSSSYMRRGDSSKFDYYFSSEDEAAAVLIRKHLSASSPQHFSQHEVFISLAWLAFRAKMRLCSTLEGFQAMAPAPAVFFGGIAEGFVPDGELPRDEYWAFLNPENNISFTIREISRKVPRPTAESPTLRMEAVNLGEMPQYPTVLKPKASKNISLGPRLMPFDVQFAAGRKDSSLV